MDPTDTIWPADDPSSAMIREVYARYGLAMFMAQVLEHGTANALFILRFLATRAEHHDQQSWSAAVDTFFSAELKKTFGKMIQTLEAVDLVPVELIDLLKQAKIIRDHLAHGFFRDHDLAFQTQSGRAHMIAMCEQATGQLKACDVAVEEFCKPFRQRHGLTDEWFNEGYRQLVEQAERDFPDGAR